MATSIPLDTVRAGVKTLADIFNRIDCDSGELNKMNVDDKVKEYKLNSTAKAAVYAVLDRVMTNANGAVDGWGYSPEVTTALSQEMRELARGDNHPKNKRLSNAELKKLPEALQQIAKFAKEFSGKSVDDIIPQS